MDHCNWHFSFAGRVTLRAVAGLIVFALMQSQAFSFPFGGWVLSEFQPNIANGGRANSITVHPANNNVLFVASETGGLFKSSNGGINWQHIDSLPSYALGSVAFVPADPTIVIVTTGDDMSTAGGGGIWRSTNGGASWVQMAAPAGPATFSGRFSAGDISIAADTGNIYVSTPYGVAISTDRGATWTLANPFAGFDRRVASVVAQTGNLVLAGGPAGIRRSTDGGINWTAAVTGPGAIWDMHALGRNPFAADQAYVVNGNTELFFTEDGGVNWTQIASAPAGGGGCGGIAFVKANGRTIRRPFGFRRFVDLYAGNRCGLSKLIASPIAGTTRFDYSGAWTNLILDHGDTRDLAFTSSHQPWLLATDGGLHKTSNGGLNWNFVGGGAAGYNALQITEVKGQWIDDIGRYDMYFGTQDNNVLASADDGVTWPYSTCCEGFFIEMMKHVATAADSKITFVACGACYNGLADPLFANITGWPNPAGPMVGNAKIVRDSFHVQGVDATAPSPFARGYAATMNLGSSWDQYATFPEDRRDIPKLSDPPWRPPFRLRLPVLYQPIRTGWDATRGFEINQLARITKRFRGAGATVTYPAMNNFGGLGINPTMFAWYQVFAVDPSNASHLLAPDLVNEKMMQSWDSGNNWSEIPGLTSLVTDSGRLQFRNWMFPQASAISISPDNPDLIAVGTQMGGVLMSGDRGATWTRVPGSEKATYITSIEWRTANQMTVSTYGRGLWRIRWQFFIPRPDLEKWCKLPCWFNPLDRRWLPDPPPERFDRGIVVYGGRIQGARAVNGTLRELLVSPGSSIAFVEESRGIADLKITETKKRAGFIGVKGLPEQTKPGSVMAGLSLGKNGQITGILHSEAVLSATVADEKSPEEQDRDENERSPVAGKPYIELRGGSDGSNGFGPGAPLQISGRNFPAGAHLIVAIDGKPVDQKIQEREGRFLLTVTAPAQFGLHSLTILDGSGKVIDGTMFIVRHGDNPIERRKARGEKLTKGPRPA